MALKEKNGQKNIMISNTSQHKDSKFGNVTVFDRGLIRRNKLSLSPALIFFVFVRII